MFHNVYIYLQLPIKKEEINIFTSAMYRFQYFFLILFFFKIQTSNMHSFYFLYTDGLHIYQYMPYTLVQFM